ncbi:ATP-dependent DNA helicase [Alcaligenes endophyticus]|nr:ATP-dependent DNA helicase [Alcaligenes endophyticus]MCX5590792.1 ATP-dependent DNA helicase [Alcaligenes endophyticus]
MYTVSVRSLCDFAARSGDLDLRFTPAPSAQEGIAGHAAVHRNRADTYQSELRLSLHWQGVLVQGRADGYDAPAHCLEEIKTYRGHFRNIAANQKALHWAQLKLYGAMLCETHEHECVTLALIYYHIDTHKETREQQTYSRTELLQFFQQLTGRFLIWARQEAAHHDYKLRASELLQFPYPTFRSGQREFAVQVFRDLRDARTLLAQAPTGIGKTLAVLFPALKAVQPAGLHKVFYLTAKNSGRQMALDSMRTLQQGEQQQWRVLELVARDKSCVHPDKACHGESCPLARGFYDNLPQARQIAITHALLDESTLAQIADEHQLCPYYLQQEMVRWADVIVGDYNHYFDAAALLHHQTIEQEWRVAVVLDEAHNLLDRARSMYSATLSEAALVAARKQAPANLKRCFGQLKRVMHDAAADYESGIHYTDTMHDELSQISQHTASRLASYVAENALPNSHPLLAFYFDLLFFAYLTEQFSTHSLLEFQQTALGVDISIRNVVPASFLSPRYGDAHGCVLFSATLSPAGFYNDVLGLPSNSSRCDIASPFKAKQLQLYIQPVSTRYADRQSSLERVCQAVGQQYERQKGNYLLFASSFEYLRQLEQGLGGWYPDIPLWTQASGMGSEQRQAFLDQFHAEGQGIGLAVLGGVFGEGVDLPGKRLIGAFIATLGLPQYNDWNEAVRDRMASAFGEQQAYNYAYLYPGMRKVVQAAGRVIRSEHDEGVLFLLDERYAQARVAKLLPAWWPAARRLG